ncbi:hypothetical protein BKP35_08655 [Anaerobacillus arseniciselenatis]|uniref:Uncharacterized protein n=1 Tax=Anaerobacillus arseniciselenatis TaxID=85682 RepID=A0A1S2LNA6_9BACI|nr:hypothetical protein BKP35_08655 [Anaerobacillus arseniciselenatis]
MIYASADTEMKRKSIEKATINLAIGKGKIRYDTKVLSVKIIWRSKLFRLINKVTIVKLQDLIKNRNKASIPISE